MHGSAAPFLLWGIASEIAFTVLFIYAPPPRSPNTISSPTPAE